MNLKMSIHYPEWASKKQQEGMDLIYQIVDEYRNFDITFKPDDHDFRHENDSLFYVAVDWISENKDENKRHHEMLVGFDFESIRDKHSEVIQGWQFIFSNGMATREVSTEIFYMDLFFYLSRVDVVDA